MFVVVLVSGSVRIRELADIFEITIYYSNSNIYPNAEYHRRYQELLSFIKQFNQDYHQNITVIEQPYLPKEYLNKLSRYSRLNQKEGNVVIFVIKKAMEPQWFLSDIAAEHNFDYWTTVFSVSPHKK